MEPYDPAKVNLVEVSIKSWALGAVALLSLSSLIVGYGPAVLIPLEVYMLFTSSFYMLEFLTTAYFNPCAVDSDSFILNDTDIHIVSLAAILEYAIRTYFFADYRSSIVFITGIIIAICGQFIRTCAMVIALNLFNHQVQRERQKDHRLVTTGVYSVVRHPSYTGFFFWFVGLQLMAHNILVGCAGAFILYRFFSKRIAYEEFYLTKFFGPEYVDYKRQTVSGIPFIR